MTVAHRRDQGHGGGDDGDDEDEGEERHPHRGPWKEGGDGGGQKFRREVLKGGGIFESGGKANDWPYLAGDGRAFWSWIFPGKHEATAAINL